MSRQLNSQAGSTGFPGSRFSSLRMAVVVAATLSATGCASIVNGGNRSIQVASAPDGAEVAIYDSNGVKISENTTPFIASLSPKGGYFKGAQYSMRFEKEGYKSHEVLIEPSVSGWFFGNILFGGLIGMLAVDPVTGAMYNLAPQYVEQPVDDVTAKVLEKEGGFVVVLVSELTDGERESLEPISTQSSAEALAGPSTEVKLLR